MRLFQLSHRPHSPFFVRYLIQPPLNQTFIHEYRLDIFPRGIYVPHQMASFTGINGTHLSTATAIDPKALPSTFDPRRLLDPKGFNKDQQQRDPKSTWIDSSSAQPDPSNVQLHGKAPENNGDPIKSKVNGSQKRDLEEWGGRGMGSLIENVHNVSQREQRPQKKPKVEHGDFDVEDDKRVGFVGGGQGGGEIGDYLKEKKKQGIAESGTVNGVVDLTGGKYMSLK